MSVLTSSKPYTTTHVGPDEVSPTHITRMSETVSTPPLDRYKKKWCKSVPSPINQCHQWSIINIKIDSIIDWKTRIQLYLENFY